MNGDKRTGFAEDLSIIPPALSLNGSTEQIIVTMETDSQMIESSDEATKSRPKSHPQAEGRQISKHGELMRDKNVQSGPRTEQSGLSSHQKYRKNGQRQSDNRQSRVTFPGECRVKYQPHKSDAITIGCSSKTGVCSRCENRAPSGDYVEQGNRCREESTCTYEDVGTLMRHIEETKHMTQQDRRTAGLTVDDDFGDSSFDGSSIGTGRRSQRHQHWMIKVSPRTVLVLLGLCLCVVVVVLLGVIVGQLVGISSKLTGCQAV